jgi:hypothetical protein
VIEPQIIRPEIATTDFLPIFLSSGFVLIFGLFFVAIYTLVKMGLLRGIYMPFAYLFWGLQAWCMYYVAVKIQSEPFTIKALMIAMVAYLTLPHLYYYLNQKADEKYGE